VRPAKIVLEFLTGASVDVWGGSVVY